MEERTEGLIDENIRHSITKLSHIHFVSTKEYQKELYNWEKIKKWSLTLGHLALKQLKRLNQLKIKT